MKQLTFEQISNQTPIVNGVPCLTTKAGIQVGRFYIAPQRNNMSPEDEYWQSKFLRRPLDSIAVRLVYSANSTAKLFCVLLATYVALSIIFPR
ncbi:hypothetical protein UFOVP1298_14 [uncultured Caudovirales phage]|jgi:hypothetical protein|uniref:Uncharacterized protein n=1 Tax=uncultured Caudovirales phage TaxID=2100421 RepID=A0A6J5RM81_9CAUD|nr:hypothetical protein UFOVP1298_14 [uncultured Caudovirales phage]